MDETTRIAVCGIDCMECDVFQATNNYQLAVEIANWLKTERQIEVKPEQVTCAGCRGDKDKHWSADCWILECCTVKKGLKYCFECEEFPCDRLVEWSETDPGYKKALEKLHIMKGNRQS